MDCEIKGRKADSYNFLISPFKIIADAAGLEPSNQTGFAKGLATERK